MVKRLTNTYVLKYDCFFKFITDASYLAEKEDEKMTMTSSSSEVNVSTESIRK